MRTMSNEEIINMANQKIITFNYPDKEDPNEQISKRARVTNPNPRVFFARELDENNNPIGEGRDYTYILERATDIIIEEE